MIGSDNMHKNRISIVFSLMLILITFLACNRKDIPKISDEKINIIEQNSENTLNLAKIHFDEPTIASVSTEYNMTMTNADIFFENLTFLDYNRKILNYDIGYVLTSKRPANLKKIIIWAFSNGQRLNIRIIHCNSEAKDFYSKSDINEIQMNGKNFFIVESETFDNILAFNDDGYIIEIYFDKIVFADDVVQPIKVNSIRMDDEMIEQVTSLFSESGFLSTENIKELESYFKNL